MDISIIIACRNGAATLGEALDSLVTQRCDRSWEIVLADNGSTDGSRAVFERHAAAHPAVAMRVIDASEQRGKSFALNKAIRASPSPFFLFCDADDVVAPGWLAAMARALETEPFVAARMDRTTLNPDWTRVGRNSFQVTGIKRISFEPFCKFAAGGTLGFHREVFEAVGGFDTAYAYMEDEDFCIRAYLAGYDIAFVPDAVYRYRLRNTFEGIRRQVFCFEHDQVLLRKQYSQTGFFLAPGAWLPVLRKLAHVLLWRAAQAALLRKPSERKLAWYNKQLGRTTGIILASLTYRVAPRRPNLPRDGMGQPESAMTVLRARG